MSRREHTFGEDAGEPTEAEGTMARGEARAVTVMDGPVGTELSRRGVPTPLPRWSADAIWTAPERLLAIHGDYAAAGATLHTANTFRTGPRSLGAASRWATRQAVSLARQAVPVGHRVAGSLAPLADCYRPDLSPKGSRREHEAFAAVLAEAGCDLILCETFPHPQEALDALAGALATGLETWLALTPGPDGSLMDPATLADTARRAWDQGAALVCVNCVAVASAMPFVTSLAQTGGRFGVYANAGAPDDGIGWRVADDAVGATPYLAAAARWVDLGASVVGGCCGTGPEHIRAISAWLAARSAE